jgi:hypothetical protein
MHIPQGFEKAMPGVWQRREPVHSVTEEIGSSYADRAGDILQSDAAHYARLLPILAPHLAELPRVSEVNAWGGGHPKLEACLLRAFPDKVEYPVIHSIDAFARDYEAADHLFQSLYGPIDVNYIPIPAITPELVAEVTADYRRCATGCKTLELHTYVHFLEHCPDIATVHRYIEATAPSPILIYGPNIAAAPGPDWWHFCPGDHNVFWDPAHMHAHLQTHYPNVRTATHSDDLFHLAW